MPGELVQTVVNAALLLIVAFIGGTLGVRRFEAIERSIGELRAEMRGLRTELKTDFGALRVETKTEIGELRTELKSEIGELRTELKSELGELRTEFAQMRSDLTHVALAVGARPAQG